MALRQVAYDATSSANPSSGTAITWSHTVANQPDRFLLVHTLSGGDTVGGGITGVTFNGVALSSFGRAAYLNGSVVELWGLVNPPVGTFTVQVNYAVATAGSFFSTSYYNASQINPMINRSGAGQASGTGTPGTTRNNSVTTGRDGSYIIDVYKGQNSITGVGAGQNNLGNLGTTGQTSNQAAATAGLYTFSYTTADNGYSWLMGGVQPATGREHTTDSLKRKAFTKTHTTDLLKRKATTRTHTTDSLKRKATLAAYTTDSYFKKAGQRLHTTSANMRKAFTRTHTANSLLRKIFSKLHTTDALKSSRFTKSYTTNSLKRKAFTRTHTTSASRRKITLRSHTTSSSIFKGGRDFQTKPLAEAVRVAPRVASASGDKPRIG